MKITKSTVGIMLSKLKVFADADIKSEQYPTDSEVAAEALWNAYMAGDITGKVIADLGSGTGILGIGCLILGAKKVFFVDKDSNALDIAKQNLASLKLKGEILNKDIKEFNQLVDTC